MPLHQTILQVFVASPNDVLEERKLLEGVIEELNQIWADSLGVTFRLYGWEFTVAPNFGIEPQAVINSQTPASYDIFIGIFWGRLGSPTKEFPSGTVEEFERALERRRLEGSPEIMLYFKDTPLSPSKIDPEQLHKLMDFKKSIGEKGGLYSTFEDHSGLEASLRSHLSTAAKNFVSPPSPISVISSSSESYTLNEQPATEIDDLGYLDHIDIYTDETEKMTNCLGRVSVITADVGEKFNKRTEQMREASGNPDKTKQIMRMTSEDMNQYSRELGILLDTYRSSRINSFDSLSKTVSLHNEIIGKDENLTDFQEILKQTINSIEISRAQIDEFRDASSKLPRMTKEINQAKRLMIETLDRFLFEVDSTHATASNIVAAIDKMP